MITILTNKTNYKFKYKEKIELWLDEPFIIISAEETIEESEESLHLVGTLTIDKFWIDDITGIIGN